MLDGVSARFRGKQPQRGTIELEGRKYGTLDKIPHIYLSISLSICLSVNPLTYSENSMAFKPGYGGQSGIERYLRDSKTSHAPAK